MLKVVSVTLFVTLALGGCSRGDSLADRTSEFGGRGENNPNTQLQPVMDILDRSVPVPSETRNAYFGDLHVHTEYSFDAYNFGTTASPFDAYRYAKGAAISHPNGYQIQLKTPLDFYAVTDHAMFMGLAREAANTRTAFSTYEVAKSLHNINAPDNMGTSSFVDRLDNFGSFIPDTLEAVLAGVVPEDLVIDVTRRAWLDMIDAAEQFNDPGKFTTFVAYEYTTATDDRGNLHRNVIFRGADKLPAVPFSRLNSQNPEGLWDWMDTLRDQGIESLAIPHNSNGSNGQMFKLVDWAGNPLDDDYVTQRLRNEPLVEVTQVKGTSDTHPLLSPNDEWADFEIYPLRVGTTLPSEPNGSYVRQALRNGVMLEQQGVSNPYQFGLVAASDTHVAGTSDDEETYFSKVGLLDATPMRRGSVPVTLTYGALLKFMAPETVVDIDGRDYQGGFGFETWSASGVTGVWAEENTRDSIYEAFRRKETFATTGPRLKVRFFASADYDDSLLQADDVVAEAYAKGVPMGGELSADAGAPTFLVWASADPIGTPLQRMQVIKGWSKDGETFEEIYDVACSDGGIPDPETRRCPDNGARVNLSDCSITPNVGDAELMTLWRDPDFDPQANAFYYVRALENPTCRWSTWDAIREGVEPRADLHKTLQERVWSSPIWVHPVGN